MGCHCIRSEGETIRCGECDLRECYRADGRAEVEAKYEALRSAARELLEAEDAIEASDSEMSDANALLWTRSSSASAALRALVESK